VVEAVDGLVEWQCWYLDDGTLVGDLAQLTAAYTKIQETARARGVELNAAKCKLWGPAFMQGLLFHGERICTDSGFPSFVFNHPVRSVHATK